MKYRLKKKYLIMGWYLDFVCPGGDCGLTCCSKEWKIQLLDEEIERYKNIEGPMGKKIMEQIDIEKKCMKCDNGKCNLLNDKGLCEIVLNIGPQYLSNTCEMFPRTRHIFGDIEERWVGISCPLVAKKLFSSENIDFSFEETEIDVVVDEEEIRQYDCLSYSRNKLVELIQAYPGEYSYEKSYIVINLLASIALHVNDGNISKVPDITDKWFDEKNIQNILNGCEKPFKDYKIKALEVRKMLRYMHANGNGIAHILIQIGKIYPDLIVEFERWASYENELYNDMAIYGDIVENDERYLMDNFLIYAIFTGWISDREHFGQNIATRIIEYCFIKLCIIGLKKQQNNITVDDLSVVIASIDRRFAHQKNISQASDEYIENILNREYGKLINLVI